MTQPTSVFNRQMKLLFLFYKDHGWKEEEREGRREGERVCAQEDAEFNLKILNEKMNVKFSTACEAVMVLNEYIPFPSIEKGKRIYIGMIFSK